MILNRYVLNTFFVLLVFLPYAFPIVKGSDNQPVLFFLLFFLLFGIRTKNYLFIFFLLVNVLVVFNLLFNWTFEYQVFSKYFAFLHFFLSVLLGCHFKFSCIHRNFNLNFIIYFFTFFSIVHFVTSGFLESYLITSRNVYYYLDVGRGISTLSPEPSFFGMTLFALYVFSVISKIPISNFNLVLILLNMTITFSLYSILLVSIILVHKYRLRAIAGLILFSMFFLSFFDIPYRAFMLLSNILQNDFSLLFDDRSIHSRFKMIEYSVSVFLSSPYFGNGFYENSLNGLISLLSSFGLIFMVISIFYIVFVLYFIQNKFLVFSFLLLFFFTNSISVSYFGFILTYIFLVALDNAKNLNSARCL